MDETILVLNAGSSSIKFQLFAVGVRHALDRLLKGQFDGIGVRPHLVAKGHDRETLIDQSWPVSEVPDVPAALEKVIGFLVQRLGGKLPAAIGHRVVHGGAAYSEPTVITSEVLAQLEPLIPLAPLHQPNNLAPIRAILERQPKLLQVACFDTAFHRSHPELADRFAIPEQLYDEGVRRYGFHGLYYEYVAGRLGEIAPDIAGKKVVIAHLGSGASMCALSGGRSVESTMGFTALDGLPMGTRPGQLDAGVVLYLMQQKGMSAKDIEYFLYNACGLKGLSGISNDVRVLLDSEDPRAKLALDFFVYRIAMLTGALAGAMGGIDGFVFTAGIGENAPVIRERVMERLSWMGAEIDRSANEHGGLRISTAASRLACYVVQTDEELMIARHTLQRMRGKSKKTRKVPK
jgi:acetate kinase